MSAYFHRLKDYFVATHDHHGEVLHGHNFQCEAELKLENTKITRQVFRKAIDTLNYTHLNDNPFMKQRTPSTENIAYCMMEFLQENNLTVRKVIVHETHLFKGGVELC